MSRLQSHPAMREKHSQALTNEYCGTVKARRLPSKYWAITSAVTLRSPQPQNTLHGIAPG